LVLPLSAGLFVARPQVSSAVTLGQKDTFQNGTTDGWVDNAANTTTITDGGPAGPGDHYLQVVSGSFGGGSRMTAYNQAQWVGNFVSAGVSGVAMDLRNFGSSTLPIRIAIREGTGSSGTPGYASTTAFSLPADGQWHAAIFLLDAGSLTPINSPHPLSTDLANVRDFRILSSTVPTTVGDFLNAKIGVDNILAVPEPAAFELLGAGALVMGMMMRRRAAG
jgi:hypothetical protein